MARSSNLHEGHKKRMRDRFVENGGFKGFSDHEILEVLLNYANIRTNMNEAAHELVHRFGSIDAVFDAQRDELLSVPGIGETSATLITMQKELFRIYEQRKFEKNDSKAVFDEEESISGDFHRYLNSLFAGLHDEAVYMFCVGENHRVSKGRKISSGVSDSVLINQRDIIKFAINSNAQGVILAHNHITGIATPSNSDVENTRILEKTLEAVNIQLIDHFIVAGNKCTSVLRDNRYKYIK